MNKIKQFVAGAVCALFSFVALAEEVTFETGGDAVWFEQSSVTYDGTPAWQVGDLASGGSVSSWIAMTVEGPCTLSFQFGFQGNSSSCNCFLDDVSIIDLDYGWGNSLTWTLNEITIAESGEHEIKVACNGWAGDSCAETKYWIADVQRTEAPAGVTVWFDANGGYCTTSEQYYETGYEYGELPTPYRSQGEFQGWYTAAIGGEKVDEDDYVKFDCTQLYAHWGMSIKEALGVGEDMTVEVEQDWQTEEPDWYGTVDLSYDGEGCAVAGFDDNNSKSFYVTVNGPGALSFVARCVNSSMQASIQKQESEYYYRNYNLAYLYSSYSYGGAQTYSVNGFKVTKYYTGGWVRFDIEAYEAGEHVFDFYGYRFSSDAGDAYALVDCMSWTPATEQSVVKFEVADGEFLEDGIYQPGETYGSLPEPLRTGYVFAGWCTDEDLLSAVGADDYVPFEGAHLYAKWKKTLAYNNENWYESEMTYTTGDKVYRTDVVTNGCVETEYWGMLYTYAPSYIEFNVTGAGFFSFWLASAGYTTCTITVDGEQVDAPLYNYSYWSDELTLTNWEKQNLTISDTGKHTVRIAATGSAYMENGGVVLVKGNEFELYSRQSTFGAWSDKVKNYDCWIKGNLPTLQAEYAKDTTPKGRVLHAITTLLTMGENTSVQSLFKGFGYTIDYMNMKCEGTRSYASAPTGNKIVDTLITVGEPLIETALEDLEAIPASMKEFDFTADDCAYFDEGVKIDYGDVLYMRAALKGLLGFAYWSKAYNVEIDYNQMAKDAQGVALKTVSNAMSLKTESAWEGIDWLAPCSAETYGASPFKAVKAGTSVYVYVPRTEGMTIGSLTLICENTSAEKSFNGDYYSYEGMEEMSTVVVDSELDEATIFRFDVSKLSNVKIANVNLKRIYCSLMTDDGYYFGGPYWSATSVDTERFILHQTKIANKIRTASALTTAKNYVKEGLRLWQQADAKVSARTCDCLHLIEYYRNDDDETQRALSIAAIRRNITKAIESLTNGSVQEYEWLDAISQREKYENTFADPLAINVNKLFTGDITRSVLPVSASDDYYVPTIYEMDPTLNGLLPETTRSQWCAFLDAKEIERSGLSPCEFDYYENDDGTITLTGIVGKVPAGALEIPAEVDGYDVSAIGEKFLEKTSGITSVTVSEGVITIGREAFHDISTLTSVSLPSTLEYVDEKCFGDCPKLATITVADGNEAVKVVNGVLCDFGQGLAVVGVSGITSLTLPKGITRIGKQAFCACTKLAKADLSASSVEAIAKNAFAGCAALTTVTFPSTLSYVDEEPFLMCSKLKTVNFLGEEPEVAGGFYFLNEEGTRTISATTYVQPGQLWTDVPGTWQGRTIEYSADAVAYWYNFNEEDDGITLCWIRSGTPSGTWTLPSTYDGHTVTAIGDDFGSGVSAVTKLVIPDTVKSIGEDAFSDMSKLQEVDFGEGLVEIGEDAFIHCGIRAVNLPASLQRYPVFAFGYNPIERISVAAESPYYLATNNLLIAKTDKKVVLSIHNAGDIVIPEGVEAIGNNAFEGDVVKSFSFPSTLQYIEPQAFNGNDASFPSTIDLSACVNLTKVDSAAFVKWANLTTVKFPASLTQLGAWAFARCTALKTVYFYGSEPEIVHDERVDASIKNPAVLEASFRDAIYVNCGDKQVNPALMTCITTYVQPGQGWDEIVASGTWQNCPIKFADPYIGVALANGSEGFGIVSGSGTYPAGTVVTLTAHENAGGAFLGWYGDPDCEYPVLLSDGSVYREPEFTFVTDEYPVTFYARFADASSITYGITFDPNGGWGEMADLYEIAYDEQVQLPSCAFENGEMRFAGWALAPDGEVAYCDGDTVSRLTVDTESVVALYAVWREIPDGFAFESTEVWTEKGGLFELLVYGGNVTNATSVKLNVSYVTAKAADLNLQNATVLDMLGNAEQKNLKFPLTLNWEAGDLEPKTIVIPTAEGKKADAPKFLMWNLSDAKGLEITECSYCIGTIEAGSDYDGDEACVLPYVTDMTGGKVSGGASSTKDAKGKYKTVTLKAAANKGYWFAGWYKYGEWISSDLSLKVTPDADFDPLTAYEARFVPAHTSLVGTYNGYARVNLKGMTLVKDVSVTDDVIGEYPFTATLAKDGKLSGSVTVGGKKVAFKADACCEASETDDLEEGTWAAYKFTIDEKAWFGKANSETLWIEFSRCQKPEGWEEYGVARLDGVSSSEDEEVSEYAPAPLGDEQSGFAYRVVDKADAKLLAPYAGTYSAAFALDDGGVISLSVSIDKSGKVKASGKYADGTALALTGTLAYRYNTGSWGSSLAEEDPWEDALVDLFATPKSLGSGSLHVTFRVSHSKLSGECCADSWCQATEYSANGVASLDEMCGMVAPYTAGCWIPNDPELSDPDFGAVRLTSGEEGEEESIDILYASKNGIITGLGSALTAGVSVKFDTKTGLLTVSKGKAYTLQGILGSYTNECYAAGRINSDGTRQAAYVEFLKLTPPEEYFPWMNEDFSLTVGQMMSEYPSVTSADTSLPLAISGLPAGLKYDTKTGLLSGAPTKAGTSQVKVTYTYGTRKITRTTTFVVAAKPADLPTGGSFAGYARIGISDGDDEEDRFFDCPFAATLDKNGALSGSITLFGKKATFKASGYTETVGVYGSDYLSYQYEAELDLKSVEKRWGKITVSFGVRYDGVFGGNGEMFGDYYLLDAVGYRNQAKDAEYANRIKPYVGNYVAAFDTMWEDSSGVTTLSIAVDKKGTAKLAGTFADGTAFSASSVLSILSALCDDGSRCEYALVQVPIVVKSLGAGSLLLCVEMFVAADGERQVQCYLEASKYDRASDSYVEYEFSDAVSAYAYSSLAWVDLEVSSDDTCLSLTSEEGVFDEARFSWKTKTVESVKLIIGVDKKISGPNVSFKLDDKTGLFSGTYQTYKIFGAMEEGTCSGVGTIVGKDGSVSKVAVNVADK